MRKYWLLFGQVILLLTSARGLGQSAAPAPEQLTQMLAAKDENGQSIITDKQRAYYDALNDHLKSLLYQAVENEYVTRPQHLALLLGLDLRPQKMEILLQDNCILCHTDSASQSANSLFTVNSSSQPGSAHTNLKDFVEGIHFRRGLSCAGCHGGDPTADFDHDFVKEWPDSGRDKDRSWILAFCARCHSDPTFMNRFNPSLPTDQLSKFKDSPHGQQLLEAKDQRAPQCISCHGVHGIRGPKDPLSMVYPKRVPETCGACHANPKTMAGFKLPDGSPLPTNQLAQYRNSVHGRDLLERGDLGAPACNDCHGNHAAMPVGVSSVSQSCSLCHANNASLFDGSKHKRAFEAHGWPQCAQCHGKHDIAKTSDAMVSAAPDALCGSCHREYAKEDPLCNATANYFHQELSHLNHSLTNFHAVSEQLAVKGLNVDPINNQLSELSDNLKKTRSYIHSFSSNSFAQVAAPGDEAVAQIQRLVTQARKEYHRRQVGLMASIVLMGLVMLTLYLKLRRLER